MLTTGNAGLHAMIGMISKWTDYWKSWNRMPFLESLFYHAQLLDFLEAGACEHCQRPGSLEAGVPSCPEARFLEAGAFC